MEIIKEKSVLKVKHESGKFYGFDLSTLGMMGIAGRPLKHFPDWVMEKIPWYNKDDNILIYLLKIFLDMLKKNDAPIEMRKRYLSFVEKISLLGLRPHGYNYYERKANEYDSIPLTAEYVGFFHDMCDRYVDPDMLTKKVIYDLKIKYNLNNDQNEKVLHLYCETNDIEFAEYLAALLAFKYFEHFSGISNILIKYYNALQEMGLKWEKSKSILETYCATMQEYEIFQYKELNENLLKHYNPLLAFSDDNFTIVVPKTEREFKFEADSQSNCVHRLYMRRVAVGERIIVFLRKNTEIDKSYVTCEIDKKLNVQNYLMKNNNSCRDRDVNDFMRKYQEYLNTMK